MLEIWSQTFYFLLIMWLGYFFKKIKLLKKEDAIPLSKIIMNLTLPCVFFSAAKGVEFDSSFLSLLVMGFLANILLILIAYTITLKKENLTKGCYIIACSGYDVGNFILPFVSAFFPGMGVIYLSTFNIANCIMCLGFTYAIAYFVTYKQNGTSFKEVCKQLFSSISFDVYILILILAIFHIEIPDALINITSKIGSVNTFLVMLMIGLKLEFTFDKENMKQIGEILTIRFLGATLLTLITIVLPFSKLIKTILTMSYFGPLVSVSSIYAQRLKEEREIVAESTTISILLSMVISSIILSI